MKTMNWKQLQEAIDKFTPEQLEMEVVVWSETTPLSGGILSIANEPIYFDYDWDYCYPESEIPSEDFESQTIRVVAEQGTPYIWFD